jgi:putative spermidine/putrescine transport system permease protein
MVVDTSEVRLDPAPAPLGGRPRAGRARDVGWLGLVPFFGYVAVLFLLPTGVLLLTAFRSTTTGALTGANLATSVKGAYRSGLLHSIEVSTIDAVIAAVLGLILAQALVTSRSNLLQQLVATASAVLTNFGGLPLAFLFVAAIGNAGVVTAFLARYADLSLSDDLHFDLYGISGVEVVYLYFLIPLMVLVITPSLAGLRPQWHEAASNLGASRLQYWRYVAGPVLAPSIGGAIALLFCSSISAYATAAALTNGTLALTPLQIAAVLSGNVLADQANVGAALALDLMIVIIPLTLIYLDMQRRTSRWLA